ncbi:MAG: MgtC/SapB family protein [Luteibaculaceae bacterium]
MALEIFIFRISLAFALGALVGLERQLRQRSAGLRTNTLVSLGSAAFVLLSASLTENVAMGDPSRVAGQIVTGIGFLGAGVIMKTGLTIQGLNTAATIWCSAAVGTLSGAGLWLEACIVAALILLTHVSLRPLGNLINKIPSNHEELNFTKYKISIRCKESVENHLRVLLLNRIKQEEPLQLRALKSKDNGSPAYAYVNAEIISLGKHDNLIEKIVGILTLEYGVTEVSWLILTELPAEVED